MKRCKILVGSENSPCFYYVDNLKDYGGVNGKECKKCESAPIVYLQRIKCENLKSIKTYYIIEFNKFVKLPDNIISKHGV